MNTPNPKECGVRRGSGRQRSLQKLGGKVEVVSS